MEQITTYKNLPIFKEGSKYYGCWFNQNPKDNKPIGWAGSLGKIQKIMDKAQTKLDNEPILGNNRYDDEVI